MRDNSKDVSLGIERSIDDLGRLVLPKEMRDKLNFEKNQMVNIKLFKDFIQIQKSIDRCYFCDNEKNITYYKNLPICKSCVDEMIEKFNK